MAKANLGQREEIEKGLKLGAKDYLVKALFTPGEIVDKMDKMIKLRLFFNKIYLKKAWVKFRPWLFDMIKF